MNPSQGSGIIGILPLILIFVIFYFLIILPQKKQQKRHQEMIKNLQKNDEVVTIGGLHGVIVNIKDKTFVLRIDENTRVEVDKTAISYKIQK